LVALCSNIKCDYIKIVNGDYCPECGAKTSAYGFFEGRSWVQDKKKYKKKHKTVEKSSKCGVLVCDKCEGYYELQEGESSEDFDLECECGGNISLTTIDDFIGKKFLVDLPYCPSCGAAKPKGNFCETCGISLEEKQLELDNSFFIEGLFNTGAKISTESIVIHTKNLTGRRTNEIEYPMSLIEKVNFSESVTGYYLNFKYEGEFKTLDVPKKSHNPTIGELEEFFKNLSISTTIKTKKHTIKEQCPNTKCLNMDLMEVDSYCPECGTKVRKIGFSETKILWKKSKKQGENKYRAKVERKWIKYADEKKKYIEKKKRKYGFLKAARGQSARLELYDNRIRICDYASYEFLDLDKYSGKEDYLFEEIISVDFKEAKNGRGSINFNIRGMHKNRDKLGGMLFYGPNTGYTLGLGSSSNTEPPKTDISFEDKWEPEFREINNIVEAKIQESKSFKTSAQNEQKTISYNEIEKLAELRDKGIITEEEFQAKKKQILGL